MHREKISSPTKFYASREDSIPHKSIHIARRFQTLRNLCIARRFHPSQIFLCIARRFHPSQNFMHREKIPSLANLNIAGRYSCPSSNHALPEKESCISKEISIPQRQLTLLPRREIECRHGGRHCLPFKLHFYADEFYLSLCQEYSKGWISSKKSKKDYKKNRCKPLQQERNTSWNLLETGLGLTSTKCNCTSLQRSCVRSKLGLSIFVVHDFFHQSYTTKGTAVDTQFWPNILKIRDFEALFI